MNSLQLTRTQEQEKESVSRAIHDINEAIKELATSERVGLGNAGFYHIKSDELRELASQLSTKL